mgnify:CR=1 FL=1
MALDKVQQVLQLPLVVGIEKFWVADQDEGDRGFVVAVFSMGPFQGGDELAGGGLVEVCFPGVFLQ